MDSDRLSEWMEDGPVACRIRGSDVQTVEFALEPGDRVVCQPNAFLVGAGRVAELHVNFGRSILTPFVRKFSGERGLLQEISCGEAPGAIVVLGASQVGRIVRLRLRRGQSIICQRGAFLAYTGDVQISVAFTRRVRAGIFGGQGAVFQRLTGDGDVFLHAFGSIIDWQMAAGEVVRVSTRNILAFDATVGYDVQIAGGLLLLFTAAGNRFLSQLEGPGRVIVQSLDAPLESIQDLGGGRPTLKPGKSAP